MSVSELRVGAARTINLGNFESLRIEASVTMNIAEGDDVAAVQIKAQAELRQLMEDTYRAQHKPKVEQRPAPRRESEPASPSFQPARDEPEY